jgi:hypothetical protein
MNGRERAIDLMDEMLSLGQSPETLLKYVVCNYLSGSEAFNAMQCAMEEYFGDEEEEEDEDEEEDDDSRGLFKGWRDDENFFDEDEEEKV